ncbi:MAG: hypothetical protein R3C49_27285 [Planctomycetaceae bacterium]
MRQWLSPVRCALTGIAYYFLTQDTPEGNFADLRASGQMESKTVKGTFLEACRDSRVWALFVIYGACFGIELTINNVAALLLRRLLRILPEHGSAEGRRHRRTDLPVLFGLMNIFARTLGGFFGDKFGEKWRLSGRTRWLFIAVFCEG